MWSDITNQKLLNVEYIQEKLDEGYQSTEETKGQDLVLVIGNTGVGKSTTCNYLLGYPMKEKKYKGRPVIETVDRTNIKIGHRVESETLYAQSLTIDSISSSDEEKSNSHICLLDCPGFLGNRTVEEKVIESVSTELAIRSARQIKGILVLISLNVLQETKVKELRELVKTLISLFKDPVEMVQYSIFIITKKYKYMPDNVAKEITIGALNSLKDHCEMQATRLHENPKLSSSEELTYVDYDKIATYFSAVLDKIDNILFVNPLDKGESRKLILDRVNSIKPRRGYLKEFVRTGVSLAKKAVGIENKPLIPITINDFSFSEGNEERIKFNKAVYERASNGNNLIGKIQEYSEKNLNLYLEISNCQTRLSTLETLLSNLEKEVCKADEEKIHCSKVDFQSIRTLESIIVENDKQIRSKKSKVSQTDERKEKLSGELESINTDVPLVFIEKSIYKNVSWWKAFGWEEMKFSADTTVEIIKVNKEMKNGIWIDEHDNRGNGVYRVTYQSNYRAAPAKASVTAYIKTKDEAGNKISIKKINEEQSRLTEQQKKLKSEIAELQSNNQALQLTVEQAKANKEDYKNSLKKKLEECKKDIHCLNSRIVQMREDRKKVRLSGIASLQEFDENRRKFDIIVSIAAILEFPSTFLKNFTSQYNDFLSCIDSCRSSFGESTSTINLDSLSHVCEKEEEKIFRLNDPITGDEIRSLVVTSAGTTFDEHSLIKQFDMTKENPSPFIYTQEDGSTEKIEYLSWQKIPDIQNYLDKQQTRSLYPSQHSFTPISFFALTRSEINKMSVDQLEEQRDKLLQEIKTMEEQLEVRKTNLETVCRQLQKLQQLQSETPGEEGRSSLLSN